MLTIIESTDPDPRTLKEILDEINEIAVTLNYATGRTIQEDITEMWRRYGTEEDEA